MGAAGSTGPSVSDLNGRMGVATVHGKVRHVQGDSIFLAWHANLLDEKEQRVIGRLNEQGEFALSFPLDKPTVVDLVYGAESQTLWLQPGTNLDVRFRSGDMAYTTRFKGVQAAENTYLSDHETDYADNETWQVLPYNIMYYEEGFVKFLDKRLERERADLDIFKSDEPHVSAAFLRYAEANIEYNWANDRLTYQDLREQVVNNEARLALTPGYFDFLRLARLDAGDALMNEIYQDFLNNYLNWQMRQDGPARSNREYYPKAYALVKEKFSGEVEAFMLGRVLRESFRNGYLPESEKLLADFRENVPNSGRYMPQLQAEFEATRTTALGAPGTEFALRTLKGDTVTLKKLRGKMVYLTFWKSTSGVSLRDLPYQQDLIHKLKGKNVEFVSISLDDDRTAWQRYVESKNLDGIQLYGGKDAQKTLAKSYGVSDVPTYILLAEDGTIASRRLMKMNNPGAMSQIVSMMGKVPMPAPPVPPIVVVPKPDPSKIAASAPTKTKTPARPAAKSQNRTAPAARPAAPANRPNPRPAPSTRRPG